LSAFSFDGIGAVPTYRPNSIVSIGGENQQTKKTQS
jgi:hypothetical protein